MKVRKFLEQDNKDTPLFLLLYPRFYPLHFFPILILQCQTRELLVPFLLRLWYDAGIERGTPALEVSTLPLGYRGGGPPYSSFKGLNVFLIQ